MTELMIPNQHAPKDPGAVDRRPIFWINLRHNSRWELEPEGTLMDAVRARLIAGARRIGFFQPMRPWDWPGDLHNPLVHWTRSGAKRRAILRAIEFARVEHDDAPDIDFAVSLGGHHENFVQPSDWTNDGFRVRAAVEAASWWLAGVKDVFIDGLGNVDHRSAFDQVRRFIGLDERPDLRLGSNVLPHDAGGRFAETRSPLRMARVGNLHYATRQGRMDLADVDTESAETHVLYTGHEDDGPVTELVFDVTRRALDHGFILSVLGKSPEVWAEVAELNHQAAERRAMAARFAHQERAKKEAGKA